MSFLDVVCCGFGAIILLLVLSKISEPVVLERVRADLSGVVAALEARLHEIRGETTTIERDLRARREDLTDARQRLRRLQATLSALRGQHLTAERDYRTHAIIEGQLSSARQDLSEEMRALLGRSYRRPASDATIGGIPVDSEYIVFIIDTSGSMFENAWPFVVQKVSEVLAVYPEVKGIQVMNDMGQYMFQQYGGRWIPDTPARRRAILRTLQTWNVFSNSSPVEGITKAIRTFYATDKRISLYVFGDEFSTGNLESVVRQVDAINRADTSGRRRVRIHAVGFPVQFANPPGLQITGIRFAALMRLLAERNGGSFVGLNRFTP